jgi:hypothetical protein
MPKCDYCIQEKPANEMIVCTPKKYPMMKFYDYNGIKYDNTFCSKECLNKHVVKTLFQLFPNSPNLSHIDVHGSVITPFLLAEHNKNIAAVLEDIDKDIPDDAIELTLYTAGGIADSVILIADITISGVNTKVVRRCVTRCEVEIHNDKVYAISIAFNPERRDTYELLTRKERK